MKLCGTGLKVNPRIIQAKEVSEILVKSDLNTSNGWL
jgi:hypothetical protein